MEAQFWRHEISIVKNPESPQYTKPNNTQPQVLRVWRAVSSQHCSEPDFFTFKTFLRRTFLLKTSRGAQFCQFSCTLLLFQVVEKNPTLPSPAAYGRM